MPDPAQPGRARVCADTKEERVQARRRGRSRRGVLVIRSYLRCYPRILDDGIGEMFGAGCDLIRACVWCWQALCFKEKEFCMNCFATLLTGAALLAAQTVFAQI